MEHYELTDNLQSTCVTTGKLGLLARSIKAKVAFKCFILGEECVITFHRYILETCNSLKEHEGSTSPPLTANGFNLIQSHTSRNKYGPLARILLN